VVLKEIGGTTPLFAAMEGCEKRLQIGTVEKTTLAGSAVINPIRIKPH
jgi:hypothetical protein